jgi:hypothetical protein
VLRVSGVITRIINKKFLLPEFFVKKLPKEKNNCA